ncbi:YybH family protein [Halohasta litorea]|uniref:YybH family protein n=1 Tax=Halohasta litorea TaxID=869891 RepID=A0ABD6DAV5_9EURY|nr:nuclear transport factor 2 family protein [Halohasta litorea]
MHQDAETTITAYYEALREGESLSSFFAEAPDSIKIGLSERLVGYADIAAGLSEQTATTDDWTVESHDLSVSVDGNLAWFSDRVSMAWTDTQTDSDYEFDTRWTGTLQRRENGDEWQFVTLHVSAPTAELQNPEDDLFSWDG